MKKSCHMKEKMRIKYNENHHKFSRKSSCKSKPVIKVFLIRILRNEKNCIHRSNKGLKIEKFNRKFRKLNKENLPEIKKRPKKKKR